MKVTMTAVVTGVYHSEKSGKDYLSVVDLSNGGMVKFGTDGVPAGVLPGKSVQISADVFGTVSSQFGQGLNIQGGEIKLI